MLGISPRRSPLAMKGTTELTGKRIALFEPYPDLATNPTLVSLIRALLREGAKVDVLSPPRAGFPPIRERVGRYSFPFERDLIPWNRGVRDWLELVRRKRIEAAFQRGYDLLLGIDPIGVVTARAYAQRFDVPFAYLSFELYFRDEIGDNAWLARVKEREIDACREARFVLIQDDTRSRLFQGENAVHPNRIVCVPVAPEHEPATARTDVLHRKFGFSDDTVIVIHSGALAHYTCAPQLVDSVWKWRAPFVLVVHLREKKRDGNPVIRELGPKRPTRLYVSTEPYPVGKYEAMISSASVGLSLYQCIADDDDSFALQKNLAHIGLASGKFSQYMKHGLPTITTAQQSFQSLSKEYEFGAVVNEVGEIPDALEQINLRQEHHSREAQRLFREKLAFDNHWEGLRNRIMSAMAC